MNRRVLFVDDDPMLLTSMDRCLGLKFDLVTAEGSPEGLAKIKAGPPFAAVVTDMRMPVMDGVEFVQQARPLTRDTVFLMLTGNQDLGTAMRAVNEGSVFRFLNKPCDPESLTAAIEQAIRLHNAEASERELLNKTFVGAIGLLTDVIETLEPELVGRASTAEQFLERLRQRAEVPPRWEYKVAAKLAFLGTALLPREERELADGRDPLSPEAVDHALRTASITARMLERVPRLERVREIVLGSATSGADSLSINPLNDDEAVLVGAALLRLAQLIEGATRTKLDVDDALATLDRLAPNAHPALVAAFRAVYPEPTVERGVPMRPRDLRAGLVLHQDVTREDGATLLRAGRMLTDNHVEKLRLECDDYGDVRLVVVTQSSFQALFPGVAVPA